MRLKAIAVRMGKIFFFYLSFAFGVLALFGFGSVFFQWYQTGKWPLPSIARAFLGPKWDPDLPGQFILHFVDLVMLVPPYLISLGLKSLYEMFEGLEPPDKR